MWLNSFSYTNRFWYFVGMPAKTSHVFDRFFRSNQPPFIDRILRLGQCLKCLKLYLVVTSIQVSDSHQLGEVSTAI